jgi:LPXTG-motif cell wall-anchored protein
MPKRLATVVFLVLALLSVGRPATAKDQWVIAFGDEPFTLNPANKGALAAVSDYVQIQMFDALVDVTGTETQGELVTSDLDIDAVASTNSVGVQGITAVTSTTGTETDGEVAAGLDIDALAANNSVGVEGIQAVTTDGAVNGQAGTTTDGELIESNLDIDAVASPNSVGVSGLLATGTETDGQALASLDVDAVASTNSITGNTDLDAVATAGALDGLLTTGLTGTSTTSVLSATQFKAASEDCDDDALPDTGGSNLGLLAAGGVLVAAGGAVIFGARRRQQV